MVPAHNALRMTPARSIRLALAPRPPAVPVDTIMSTEVPSHETTELPHEATEFMTEGESPEIQQESIPSVRETPVEEIRAETPVVDEPVQEEVGEQSQAISFKCPGCGQEIEAPREVIGQDAECPMCGRIVVVPAKSEPGTMYGGGAEAAPVVSAREAEQMEPAALKNRTIRIDTTLAGLFDEPTTAPQKASTPEPQGAAARPPQQHLPSYAERMISFFCKGCHQEIEASSDMIGSSAECPNCGTTFEVPYFSEPGTLHYDGPRPQVQEKKLDVQAQKHSTMRIDLPDDF